MANLKDHADLKAAIFREVRRTHYEYANHSDADLKLLLFQMPNTIRLSLTGFRVLKKIFTAHSFPIPVELKSKHRQALSTLEYPYFFTQKRLIVFSDMDASMINLCGGVVRFLETASNIDS